MENKFILKFSFRKPTQKFGRNVEITLRWPDLNNLCTKIPDIVNFTDVFKGQFYDVQNFSIH